MTSIYLHAASSITNLPIFEKSGFANEVINSNGFSHQLEEPDYKKYIHPSLIRRTSSINKMAIACAKACMDQYPMDYLDAIIVGTGLGCLTDSERFLNIYLKRENDSMISPTAFIQSGHNSISGQVALLEKNHGYNMTHVQTGISFEHALLDAILCANEGKQNILVGSVDESIDLQSELAKKFSLSSEVIDTLSGGSSFFIVNTNPENSIAVVKDVFISRSNLEDELNNFLLVNGLEQSDLDMALIGYNLSAAEEMNLNCPQFEYTKACGRYFSSSAFGFHLAADYLQSNKEAKNALIINNADSNRTGLVLMSNE